MRENDVASDDEADHVLVGNSTEPGNFVTLGNNTTQLTTGNFVPRNVPHNLENIPVGHESNNFVINRGLAEDVLHSPGDTEENRSNLGQESDEVLNPPDRQSNSRNVNADNIAQNEIVDSMHDDHNLVNTATAAANDDDCDDLDYDDEPSDNEMMMLTMATWILMTVIFMI